MMRVMACSVGLRQSAKTKISWRHKRRGVLACLPRSAEVGFDSNPSADILAGGMVRRGARRQGCQHSQPRLSRASSAGGNCRLKIGFSQVAELLSGCARPGRRAMS